MLGLVLGLALRGAVDRAPAGPSPGAVQASAPAPPRSLGPLPGDVPPSPGERRQRRRQLLENLRLADHTYCSYRAASQYPPGSRPMAENADQDRPNDPVASSSPMRLDGGGSDERIQLRTSQSRVYLGAGEAAAFSLRAVDAEGRTLPLVVTRAVAGGVTHEGARQGGQVAIPFVDDGSGAYAGVLAPSQGGLAGFDGTIRTEVRYSAGGRGGGVQFDVVHTPALPATWTGQVRQALEEGALNFYLTLDVRQPGRYVVNGRVDDARGQPFALLTFNEVLGPGPQEVRLTVFGKLVRDRQPAQPLRLRDVDGYLLKEDIGPAAGSDRALLPRLQGPVASGGRHDAAGFSDAEWQSEERTRHLAEFSKDLVQARARLRAFDPAMPLPPGACAPPPARP